MTPVWQNGIPVLIVILNGLRAEKKDGNLDLGHKKEIKNANR